MIVEISLRWLIVLRIVAFSTLLLAALLIQATTDVILPIDYLYYLTAGTFGLSLVYIGLRERLRRPKLEAGIQLGGDLLIVSALVWFTGGIESSFSFLYVVTIGAAASMFYRRGALLAASAASILYGAMVDLMVLGVIPTPGSPGQPVIGPPAPQLWTPGRVYYSIFVNIVGYYIVALLASFLAEKRRAAREELEALRTEYDRLQAFATEVVSSLTSGLITTERDGRITFVNAAGARLLGTESGPAWRGRPVEATGLFPTGRFSTLREIADAGPGAPFTARIGELAPERAIAGTVSRLTDGTGQRIGHIVLFEDVTEFESLERQVRVQERMAAVGEMAAGIAHEIRNPLASIAGSVQVLQRETGLTQDGEALAAIVLKESDRLNRIIGDFLRYVRPPRRAVRSFDVAAHLEETVQLLRNSRELGAAHQLRLHVSPASFSIAADPDQIRQVLWNVATNGLRAMPLGGDLNIEGTVVGDWYSIVVRDTGVGMSDEERERLFQPFKTKFDGGSGLGMAIVWRIVEEHGGRIDVDSAPGRGTTVRIDLPVEGRPVEDAGGE